MSPRPAWRDDDTLICERCGYVLEGLARSGACPECGKPVAESLPERRTGTPWQHERTWGALGRTGARVLLRPVRTLDTVRIDGRGARSLARRCCVAGLPLWGVLMALTWVETRGLVFIGRRRGFRITPDSAWTICAHGAFGWVIASAGLWSAIALLGGSAWYARGTPVSDYDPDIRSALVGLALGLGGGLVLMGFLFFEVFAWLGLRRLRYANRLRPVGHEETPDRT